MNSRRWAVGMVFVVSWAGVARLAAQVPQGTTHKTYADPNVRAQAVAKFLAESRAAKAEALAFAGKHNLPVRGESERGVYELMRVENGVPLYYQAGDAIAGITTGANLVHASPYDLSGAGLTVGIWDSGTVLTTHQEFGTRANVLDVEPINSHGTGVAGTVGSAGADPYALGMAPSVTLDSYGWNDDLAEMAARGASYAGEAGKIYLSSHSYGYLATGWEMGNWSGSWGWHWPATHGNFGRYLAIWTSALDQVCYDAPYYLPFFAAMNNRDDNPAAGDPYYIYLFGNWLGPYSYDPQVDEPGDGVYKNGYDTLLQTGVPKNIMTVGAVGAAVSGGVRDPAAATMTDFSGWGPTDDGRVKPDIVGDGVDVFHPHSVADDAYATWGGTSSSTPNVSGSAILLVEHYGDLFPGQAMRASTLKGLILHTADDLGNPGPDYVYGWGLMNTLAAADQITKHKDYPAQNRIVEARLTPADPVHSYQFNSEGMEPIRATICWTDPPGPGTTVPDDPTPMLVNDLDLRILGPGGTPTFYPYVLDLLNPSDPATTGDNVVDNVEQVYIAAPPAAGTYTVEVSYKGTLTDGEQYYSLLISGQGPASAGSVVLDREAYHCADAIQIEVIDADLRNNGTQDVTLIASGGDSETVTLAETPAGSAIFVASVGTSGDAVVTEDGVLQVSDGETVTATYDDADSPAVVQDIGAVDCVAPVISNITTTNVTAAGATVTFDSSETASVQVRYGTGCGSLTDTRTGFVVGTAHQVLITGLQPETQYFYEVNATDAAGNVGTDDNGGACHGFTTLVWAEYYTEAFNMVDNDLDYQTITFVPDGSADFYSACREAAVAFPTDPAGGTVLSLSLDAYSSITLAGGEQVSLYGVNYGTFHVGSNGYITFVAGDTDYTESIPEHFAVPRISGLFDDFNVPAGGTVSWKQLADRAAVTYENVPEWSAIGGGWGSNNFQIEMFFDGTIRITWLGIDARDGLAGLSAGNGVPATFLESDLSGYAWCTPPADCNANGNPDVWDILSGTSLDCNANGIPDECDISDGTSVDSDADGIPDECQDCNGNGVLDSSDIAAGYSLDCNANAIPDECEYLPGIGCPGDILPADMDCDADTDGDDIQRFVGILAAGGYTCQADVDQDGSVGMADIPGFVSVLLGS